MKSNRKLLMCIALFLLIATCSRMAAFSDELLPEDTDILLEEPMVETSDDIAYEPDLPEALPEEIEEPLAPDLEELSIADFVEEDALQLADDSPALPMITLDTPGTAQINGGETATWLVQVPVTGQYRFTATSASHPSYRFLAYMYHDTDGDGTYEQMGGWVNTGDYRSEYLHANTTYKYEIQTWNQKSLTNIQLTVTMTKYNVLTLDPAEGFIDGYDENGSNTGYGKTPASVYFMADEQPKFGDLSDVNRYNLFSAFPFAGWAQYVDGVLTPVTQDMILTGDTTLYATYDKSNVVQLDLQTPATFTLGARTPSFFVPEDGRYRLAITAYTPSDDYDFFISVHGDTSGILINGNIISSEVDLDLKSGETYYAKIRERLYASPQITLSLKRLDVVDPPAEPATEPTTEPTTEAPSVSPEPIIDTVPPTLITNASSLVLSLRQKTTKFKVTMSTGDTVASWTSSNTKIFTVSGKANGTCTLKAGKKTGKAKLTITLASGLTKTIPVKVQKKKVATKKLSLLSEKKLTLKKGAKFNILTDVLPITSQDKLTFTTSKKSIVTVSKKGVIKAKKAGSAVITVKSGKKKIRIKIKVNR